MGSGQKQKESPPESKGLKTGSWQTSQEATSTQEPQSSQPNHPPGHSMYQTLPTESRPIKSRRDRPRIYLHAMHEAASEQSHSSLAVWNRQNELTFRDDRITLAPNAFPVVFMHIGDLLSPSFGSTSESIFETLALTYCTGNLDINAAAQLTRLKRFIHLNDRARVLGSIVLQRCLLHRLHKWPAEQPLCIARTSYGKPFVDTVYCPSLPERLHFNITHDGDYIAMAVDCHCLIGIDICDTRRQFDFADLQAQFAHSEWKRIVNSPEPMREFYKYWCLKESFIKAVGSGLSIEPHRLEFIHSNEVISVLLDGKPQVGWQFIPFDLDAHHLGCVAKGPYQDAVDVFQTQSSSTPVDAQLELDAIGRTRVALYRLSLNSAAIDDFNLTLTQ